MAATGSNDVPTKNELFAPPTRGYRIGRLIRLCDSYVLHVV